LAKKSASRLPPRNSRAALLARASLIAVAADGAPERQSLAPAKHEDLRSAPMKSAHLPTPTRHIYGIDVMRFLAAVTVAVFHFTWETPSHFAFAPWGWIGVEVFFVVSGIVIAAAVKGSSPGAFAFNRFLRLYPAAWICGLIGAIVLRSAFRRATIHALRVFFVAPASRLDDPFRPGAFGGS
jgi:Acyltransferase family